jgi:hypothetical protein
MGRGPGRGDRVRRQVLRPGRRARRRQGAQVEIAGVVTGKLDGNQVAVDITARSGDAKVLTRAHAVVRLPTVLAQGDETLIPLEPP